MRDLAFVMYIVAYRLHGVGWEAAAVTIDLCMV